MAKGTRNLMTAVAVAASVFTVARPAAAQDESTTIVLHLDDSAHVDSRALATAMEEATRVYSAAGIQTIWVNGRITREVADDGKLHLAIVVLSREKGEQMIASDRVGDHVLGLAGRPTRRAYIFHHRVVQTAAAFARDPGSVLGTVIAHELGHLLLPENSHSRNGIMRADLNLRSPLPEQFTSKQSATIRSMLAADLQMAAR